MAVMIISEHSNYKDAFNAAFDAMKEESKNITNRKIEKLKPQGIKAVLLYDAVKDMTPWELESFLEERNRKFINPLLNKNIKMLEQKR
jgi:hypothetical protein